MSKTIIYTSMTLDGFIAGKNDDLSWLEPYMGVDYGYKEFYDGIGAIILGKRTYDHIVRNWDWPYGNIPAFILSSAELGDVPKGAEVIKVEGDIADVLARAKARTDKDIWIGGGAHVMQEFLNKQLADELHLTLVPTMIGEGVRLLDNVRTADALKLKQTTTYDKGLVQLIYDIQ
jgi:dihydrofolate reductase